ncbi:MAG: hypothetical protein EX271_02485 [Acidimicrobiales bacterium]|nr:hypothetical protein [Hyphomonadaceae bacterium]RZV44137.1 MAG: hypothetical protein EX271_02485 [Acidimicrobiales bacterium]
MATTLQQHNALLDAQLKDAARALLAGHAALPSLDDLSLEQTDAAAAHERGYYKPSEDERLRESYVQYMGVRAALWQTVQSLLPYIELPRKFKKGDWYNHLKAFSIAFCCAAMLMRSGYYLVDMANQYPVVRKKLDEGEPRFGIAKKQFTEIFNSLVSSQRISKYHNAVLFFQKYKDEIYASLQGQLFEDVARVLIAEEPFLELRLSNHIKRKAAFEKHNLKNRGASVLHKTLFFVFETFGNDLSELNQPLVKPLNAPKRVSAGIRQRLVDLAKPGDVFVTRHDDAMTNLFLPGFWPHAALYIGTDDDRDAIGVELAREEHQSLPGVVHFLEAKKDGVLFRPSDDTLQVDSCVILRPKINQKSLSDALNRAISHGGKLYDFVFDFSKSERLVCSELIYRTYDGCESIHFSLSQKAGNNYLSTEDFLNQSLSAGWFDVIALYGVGNQEFFIGDAAKKRLISSYDVQLKPV